MKIRLPLIVLLAILFVSSNSFGQDGSNPLFPEQKTSAILIGPTAGVNIVNHAVNLQTFDNTFDDYQVNNVLCPSFADGAGIGFWVGLTYEYPIGNAKTSNKSIIGRVLYNYMPGTFEILGDEYLALDNNHEVVNTTTKHDGEVAYSTLTIEAAFKLNISKKFPLGVTVGPTFDLLLGSTHTQTYSLVEPNNVHFNTSENPDLNYSNNNRTVTTFEGDMFEAASFRLGIKIGVQYEILMGQNMLVPAIYYNYGITEATSAHDWRVNAIQIGADFRFSLKSPF